MADVIRHTKSTAPQMAIFCTQSHTMGFRAGKEYEFFDIEKGLGCSSDEREVLKVMRDVFRDGGYGPAIGMRVVKLAS